MEKILNIPEDVNVTLDKKTIKLTGEKGELEKEFKYFHDIKIDYKDNKIIVAHESEERKVKAMAGTIVAHIRNMIKGVKEGYTYNLSIVYSHFPINVKIEGNKIIVTNFLGEKTPRNAKIVGDSEVKVNKQEITVSGTNKEDVSQTAANMETACRLNKFDRRIFQDGIYITKKGK